MENKTCANCNETFKFDDTVNHNGTLYCEDCFNELFTTCSICNQTISNDDSHYIDDEIVCDSCSDKNYYPCDDCGEIVKLENTNEVTAGKLVCNCCFDNYRECGSCGDWFDYNNSGGYCEDCDQHYCCDECHSCDCGNNNENERKINLTPINGDDLGEIVKIDTLVGVEIESEDGNFENAQEKLLDCCGYSPDGSLDNGMEVQTPPASLNELERIINHTCKVLTDNEFVVNSYCGLHIHINANNSSWKQVRNFLLTYLMFEDVIYSFLPPSRKNGTYSKPLTNDFSQLKLLKISSFNDFEAYWYGSVADNISNFSYREASKICNPYQNSEEFMSAREKLEKEWNKKRGKDYRKDLKKDKWNNSRYYGVNLHSFFFRGTVELRHHSGTLNPIKILNWIQFNLELFNRSKQLNRSLLLKAKQGTGRDAIEAMFNTLHLSNKEYFLARFDFLNRIR